MWTAIYPSGLPAVPGQPLRNPVLGGRRVSAGVRRSVSRLGVGFVQSPERRDRAAHPGDLRLLHRRRRRSRAGGRRREIGTGSARFGRGTMGGDHRPQRPREPDRSSTRPRSACRLELARHSDKTSVPRHRRGARFASIRLSFRPRRVNCQFTTRERRRVSDTALQSTIARPTRSSSSWQRLRAVGCPGVADGRHRRCIGTSPTHDRSHRRRASAHGVQWPLLFYSGSSSSTSRCMSPAESRVSNSCSSYPLCRSRFHW